ncbi:YaaC family protein [Arthrobacter pigmenti]
MPASRQKLFTSSLEQAQQQFEAAARVGFESRALNLYYGLFQAGRAIAAALTPQNVGKSPEVSGHGLRIHDFQSATARAFWEIRIRAEGNDATSYGRLASLLRSAPLVSPISLGELWNMIPELHLDHPVGNYNKPRWTHKPYRSSEFPPETTLTLQATEDEMEHNAAKLRALYLDLREASILKFKGGSYSEDDGIRTDEAVFSYEGQHDPSR